MHRSAPVEEPIQDLFATRWSPYSFDPERGVSEADLRAVFEAARWAMSSYNAQPWRYIVAARERRPELWERIHGVLVEGNQPWARNAPVLALGIVEHHFEHNDKPNKAAVHDMGAASAFLTIEATARGLSVHQMIGIEPERAREAFEIRGSREPLTALAIGYAAATPTVPEAYAERERGPRKRKPLSEIVLEGGF